MLDMHIYTVMQNLHPSARVGFDWAWANYGDGPHMAVWNEEKLGPLNLETLEAEAARIAAFVAVPASITRRQCALALHAASMITGPEMVAMATVGTPPAMISSVFNAMPEAERYRAQVDFAAASYERANPLLNAVMTASGSSAADIDNFFRAAAQH
jgi:hypothetical protein